VHVSYRFRDLTPLAVTVYTATGTAQRAGPPAASRATEMPRFSGGDAKIATSRGFAHSRRQARCCRGRSVPRRKEIPKYDAISRRTGCGSDFVRDWLRICVALAAWPGGTFHPFVCRAPRRQARRVTELVCTTGLAAWRSRRWACQGWGVWTGPSVAAVRLGNAGSARACQRARRRGGVDKCQALPATLGQCPSPERRATRGPGNRAEHHGDVAAAVPRRQPAEPA
jgi:hypothetical protein